MIKLGSSMKFTNFYSSKSGSEMRLIAIDPEEMKASLSLYEESK